MWDAFVFQSFWQVSAFKDIKIILINLITSVDWWIDPSLIGSILGSLAWIDWLPWNMCCGMLHSKFIQNDISLISPDLRVWFNIKTVFPSTEISIIKIRQTYTDKMASLYWNDPPWCLMLLATWSVEVDEDNLMQNLMVNSHINDDNNWNIPSGEFLLRVYWDKTYKYLLQGIRLLKCSGLALIHQNDL